MTVVEVSIGVDAPPERVWEVVADPRNLPRWDRRIVEVTGVPDSGLRRGTEYRVGLRFLGARAHATVRVDELRPPDFARVELHGLVEATVETTVASRAQGRSRLTHRIDYRFPGGPLGGLAARAVRMLGATALLRRGVEAQKRQAEDAVPGS